MVYMSELKQFNKHFNDDEDFSEELIGHKKSKR